jgi:AcrR family transcriptional regulator
VARWEPDSRMRLVRAAIDLFAEQGYDETTVAEIAARAGLTKATFFRQFRDKREVLFAGQDAHRSLLAEGVAAAPAGSTPLQLVAAGLDAVTGSFVAEQRAFGARLRAVVASHDELVERDAFKRAGLATALATALRDRGVPDVPAGVAADLGVEALHRAFARWSDGTGPEDYGALARAELDALHAAAVALR